MTKNFKYGKVASYTYNFLTNNLGHRKYYDEFFSQSNINLKDNCQVLDVGCGSCLLTIGLLKEYRKKRGVNIKVHGLDISKDILKLAYKNIIKAGFKDSVKLYFGNAQNLSKLKDFISRGNIPIQDNTYDLVMCSGVLEYIEDMQKVAYELQRVLKPNGTIIISSIRKSLIGKISSKLWKFKILPFHDINSNLDTIQLEQFYVDSNLFYMKSLRDIYTGVKTLKAHDNNKKLYKDINKLY